MFVCCILWSTGMLLSMIIMSQGYTWRCVSVTFVLHLFTYVYIYTLPIKSWTKVHPGGYSENGMKLQLLNQATTHAVSFTPKTFLLRNCDLSIVFFSVKGWLSVQF